MSRTQMTGSVAGQLNLFAGQCRCGRRAIELPRLHCCRLCRRQAAHERQRHNGHRRRVMRRDRRRCRVCASHGTLAVHHRQPGRHRPDTLITLCRACHAQVHHAGRLRQGVPELLAALWSEMHPDQTRQQQLPFSYLALRKTTLLRTRHSVTPARHVTPSAQITLSGSP